MFWDWLIVVGICTAAYFLLKARNSRSQPPVYRAPAAPAFHWPARGEYEFEVVGESHRQEALRRLAGDHGDDAAAVELVASLIPEDTNPHDDKAVKVEIDGYHVGYLSREDARSYRRRLAAKKLGMVVASCGARIGGGHKKYDGSRASYGVTLDIKPFG